MTELLKFRRPEHLQTLSDSERAAFIQRCGEHDHDHRAAGIYRRVSSTIREAAARGGIRERIPYPSRGLFRIAITYPVAGRRALSIRILSLAYP